MHTAPHEHLWSVVRAVLLVAAMAALLFWMQRRWGTVSRFLAERRAPVDLAIIRIVIFTLLAARLSLTQVIAYARLDPALVVPPFGWGHLASHLPRSGGLVEAAYWPFLICAICAAVGLFFRYAGPIALATGFYLYTLPQLFGKVNHDHHLFLFGLILCMAPSADALSLDAALAKRRGLHGPEPLLPDPLLPARRYGFPLVAMMAIMSMGYFFPGIWKVAHAGGHWFTGENMRLMLVQKLLEVKPTHLQTWMLGQPRLLQLGATGSVFFEIAFLPLMLSRKTRPLVVLMGLAFHNSTWLLMSISFLIFQFSYVIFIDWASLFRRLGWFTRPDSQAEEAQADVQSSPSLRFVAAAAFAGLVLMGITHRVSGWPLACYPTFDYVPDSAVHIVSMSALSSTGQTYTDNLTFDDTLEHLYSPERWRETTTWGANLNAPYPAARGRGLVEAWESASGHTDLRHADLAYDTYAAGPDGALVKTASKPLASLDLSAK